MTELKLALKMTADASGLVGGVNAARSSLDDLARESLVAGESIKRTLGASGQEAGEALKRELNGAGRAAGEALGQGLAGAAAANDNVTRKTKLTREQLLALQYTASDVAASLGSGASPFTVLLQQGGQLLQAFPNIAGKVLGFGAMAAAVAAPVAIIGTRITAVANETRELAGTIKALGNEAGVSADQLHRMAVESTKAGGSRQEAYQAALALARNPAIKGADMFQDILTLAPDVAAVLGTTIPIAAEKMGEAFRAGAEGVRKLDEDLNFLQPTHLSELRHLEGTADKAGAARLAIGALRERISGTAKAVKSGIPTV